MTNTKSPKSWSDQSGQSDPFGVLALFRSYVVPFMSDQSDQPAIPVFSGPTDVNPSRAKKRKQKQSGPTGPTGPTQIHQQSAAVALADSDALDFLDRYEERAAIREFDGRQPRAEAETEALVEVAKAAGLTTDMLRKFWAEHPDSKAYIAQLSVLEPIACGELARTLEWDSTRAWQAEARLRAAGLVKLDGLGRAEVRKKQGSK